MRLPARQDKIAAWSVLWLLFWSLSAYCTAVSFGVTRPSGKGCFWRLNWNYEHQQTTGGPGESSSLTVTHYYYNPIRSREIDSLAVSETYSEYRGEDKIALLSYKSYPAWYEVTEHWYDRTYGAPVLAEVIVRRYDYLDAPLLISKYTGQYALKEETCFSYDPTGNQTEMIRSGFAGQLWTVLESDFRTYNQDDLLTSRMYSVWDNTEQSLATTETESRFYGQHAIPDSIHNWSLLLYPNYEITERLVNHFDADGNAERTDEVIIREQVFSGVTSTEFKTTHAGYVYGPRGFVPVWKRSYSHYDQYSWSDSTHTDYTYSDDFRQVQWVLRCFDGVFNLVKTSNQLFNEDWILLRDWGSYSDWQAGAGNWDNGWEWDYIEDNSVPDEDNGVLRITGITPNPFSASAKISFLLWERGSVSLEIFNLRGERVRSFKLDDPAEGETSVEWDGKDNSGRQVASGVYLIRIINGKLVATGKVVRIK